MVGEIEIAGRKVGPQRECLVIAEAGVNHNGDLGTARRLVSAARESKADVVKFQTWITEKLVASDAPTAPYQRRHAPGGSQYSMLKALELGPEDFRLLKADADAAGILFLSTPDEEESADLLESLGVAAFKMGSGEVTNLPFLRHVARKGKPIILSTGMSTLEEVRSAVEAVRGEGNEFLVLLHCVSAYPADPAECNLKAMHSLADQFGCPVGFSDHTMGFDVTLAAVALGAAVIEKHFTLDRRLPGPDQLTSLEPAEFAAMVRAIRRVESSLGDGVKCPTSAEAEVRHAVRKVIVLTRSVRRGEVIGPGDLALRRASGGLAPSDLSSCVGRRARCDIEANTALRPDLLE